MNKVFCVRGDLFPWSGFGISFFMFWDSETHMKNMFVFCVFMNLDSFVYFLDLCACFHVYDFVYFDTVGHQSRGKWRTKPHDHFWSTLKRKHGPWMIDLKSFLDMIKQKNIFLAIKYPISNFKLINFQFEFLIPSRLNINN
jgi:hypothetical protein